MARSPEPGHQAHWRIGYTAGVFDLFHVGHLNLLRSARERCSFLIVGITSDELAEQVRGSRPLASMLERLSIVQHVRHVDHVVPQLDRDKLQAWRVLQFDVLFVGDNLRDDPYWQRQESVLRDINIDVCWLPATYVRDGELLERGLEDLVFE